MSSTIPTPTKDMATATTKPPKSTEQNTNTTKKRRRRRCIGSKSPTRNCRRVVRFSPKKDNTVYVAASNEEYDRTAVMPELYECDQCGRTIVSNVTRYHCVDCDIYDLCAPCFQDSISTANTTKRPTTTTTTMTTNDKNDDNSITIQANSIHHPHSNWREYPPDDDDDDDNDNDNDDDDDDDDDDGS